MACIDIVAAAVLMHCQHDDRLSAYLLVDCIANCFSECFRIMCGLPLQAPVMSYKLCNMSFLQTRRHVVCAHFEIAKQMLHMFILCRYENFLVCFWGGLS